MLEIADGLVCGSPFVWNPSPDSVLGTAGGSCSPPFVWNQSAALILRVLLAQSLPWTQVPQSKLLVVHAQPSLGQCAVTSKPPASDPISRFLWELLVAVCSPTFRWNP